MKINWIKVLICICCVVSFLLTIFLFESCDGNAKKPTTEPAEPSPTPGPVEPTPTPGPVEPSPTPGPSGAYKVGDIGPAGGYIFYVCDADNNVEYVDFHGETKTNEDGLISSECGWRYLEAAPEDLSYKGYSGQIEYGYAFGYCKTYGTTYRKVGTSDIIGAGKSNTEALVKAEVEYNMYLDYAGEEKGTYAALACARYSKNGFDDWFLPSKNEIYLMYTNLYKKGLGSFDDSSNYWTSTESSSVESFSLNIKWDSRQMEGRSVKNRVRAIRSFK